MDDHHWAELRQAERRKYNETYYQEHYWAEDLKGHKGNRGLSYDDEGHNVRFAILKDALYREFLFSSFLDAGCGPGILLSRLLDDGIDAVGFDVSLAAAQIWLENQNIASYADRFAVAGVEAIPLPDFCADMVFCSDVLEHIPLCDVVCAAKELARVARKALVLTINMDNPYQFHPTILSSDSWKTIFMATGMLRHLAEIEGRLQSIVETRRPEYSFFVFERIGSDELEGRIDGDGSPTRFVCPLTKTPLRLEGAELISDAAERAFPFWRGIPVLLPEESRLLLSA